MRRGGETCNRGRPEWAKDHASSSSSSSSILLTSILVPSLSPSVMTSPLFANLPLSNNPSETAKQTSIKEVRGEERVGRVGEGRAEE